jgi:hypothetical protein
MAPPAPAARNRRIAVAHPVTARLRLAMIRPVTSRAGTASSQASRKMAALFTHPARLPAS